jgi:hypothetical protein
MVPVDEASQEAAVPPQAPLAARLREWHVATGAPSVRTIAAGIAGAGHSTVADALSGRRIPSWRILSEIVEYLGGDLDEARALWAGSRTAGMPEPEVAALSVAVRAIGGLDRPAQRRVLAYLKDRFGEERCEP